MAGKVVVRKVWQSNLDAEFALIESCLQRFRLASMDTEFPGTIFKPEAASISSLSAVQHYALMKENVDALNIIQLGLTLSDDDGNLPTLGTASRYVWEFNFRDFDSDCDLYNPDSVAFLRAQGINFAKHKRRGINSRAFAAKFLKSGLGMGRAWVTFHGLYDFGFMIKILTRQALPERLEEFMMLLHHFLGIQVYDVKPISHSFSLRGGLDKVAETLSVKRAAGKSHHAGSDSLLTMQVFMRLINSPNRSCTRSMLHQFNYQLYGLTSC